MAAQMSYSEKSKTVNSNDVARLSSPTPELRAEAIRNNINISKKENDQGNVAEGYSQLADVNIQQKDIYKAEENLNNAYQISKKKHHSRRWQLIRNWQIFMLKIKTLIKLLKPKRKS
jgi:hypothetical protein